MSKKQITSPTHNKIKLKRSRPSNQNLSFKIKKSKITNSRKTKIIAKRSKLRRVIDLMTKCREKMKINFKINTNLA